MNQKKIWHLVAIFVLAWVQYQSTF